MKTVHVTVLMFIFHTAVLFFFYSYVGFAVTRMDERHLGWQDNRCAGTHRFGSGCWCIFSIGTSKVQFMCNEAMHKVIKL